MNASETGVSYVRSDMGSCSAALKPFALHQYLHVNKLSSHTCTLFTRGKLPSLGVVKQFRFAINYLFDVDVINKEFIAVQCLKVISVMSCGESEGKACFIN